LRWVKAKQTLQVYTVPSREKELSVLIQSFFHILNIKPWEFNLRDVSRVAVVGFISIDTMRTVNGEIIVVALGGLSL